MTDRIYFPSQILLASEVCGGSHLLLVAKMFGSEICDGSHLLSVPNDFGDLLCVLKFVTDYIYFRRKTMTPNICDQFHLFPSQIFFWALGCRFRKVLFGESVRATNQTVSFLEGFFCLKAVASDRFSLRFPNLSVPWLANASQKVELMAGPVRKVRNQLPICQLTVKAFPVMSKESQTCHLAASLFWPLSLDSREPCDLIFQR